MLLRSPSSLPISASVVALKPFRAKHFAAAFRIAATLGLFQSTARGATDSTAAAALSSSAIFNAVSADIWRLERCGGGRPTRQFLLYGTRPAPRMSSTAKTSRQALSQGYFNAMRYAMPASRPRQLVHP